MNDTKPNMTVPAGWGMAVMIMTLAGFAPIATAEEYSDAYYELVELYAEHQAAICDFKKDSPDRVTRELTQMDFTARQIEITTSGRLTPTDLQALGSLQQKSRDCGSPIEVKRRKAEEEFFDIRNQHRLACLPRDERVKAYMDHIRTQNPGFTDKELLAEAEQFIEDYDRHREQRAPGSRETLCNAGNQYAE